MQFIEQRLGAAYQFHRAGRLGEAEALYRGIVREQPGHPDALHMLGLLAHQAGRHAEAVELIRQALAGPGSYPLFHTNIGGVYLALGQTSEAVAACREAVRLQQDNAEFHNNLGVALRRRGELDAAAASFQEALRLDPNHIDARCNLGAVLQRQGKYPESLTLLQEAVRRMPNHARARNNLGSLLIAMESPELALPHLKEAVRLRPNFTEALSFIGVAYREMNQGEEALKWFREALRSKPDDSSTRNTLGHTLETLGRIDEAVPEFEEALRCNPNDSMAFSSLGRLVSTGHYRFRDEQLQRIQDLAARPDMPSDDLFRLHQALAWAFDKSGDFERAFAHCRRSKELRKQYDVRRGEGFDPGANRQTIDHLIAVYTPAWFERVASFGSDSDRPIFVVGMMRSGTTLTEQILASHPKVFGAGELPDIDRLLSALPLRMGVAQDPVDCLWMLDAALTKNLAEEYLERLRLLSSPAAARVVDKLPFNYLRLGFIATLFPRARIIHCRRNPVDTCMSCYFQNFKLPHPYTLDLRHMGLFYRGYERLMAHWARVLPVPVFHLDYEKMTADQEGVSRRLLDFCGLDWDERCLRFSETKRVVRTASAMQVRQSMYRTSVGKWQRYEAHIQPLLEALRTTDEDS
jgi:tetratricopeptide (TPR) repeat protein